MRFVVVLAVGASLAGLFFVLRPQTPEDGPRERTFEVSVVDGEMAPRSLRAEEGDRITLVLTADSPREVHLHGYDVGGGIAAGVEHEVSFRAHLTGRFVFEDHRSGRELGVLLVYPG